MFWNGFALVLLILGATRGQTQGYYGESLQTLANYVSAVDSATSYELVDSFTESSTFFVQLFTYSFTSQRWDVDTTQPLWTHWVQACFPLEAPNTSVITLFIDGGSRPDSTNIPTLVNASDQGLGIGLYAGLCASARQPTAIITAVPNAPIEFTFQPDISYNEDALLAKSYERFMCATGDEPLTQEVAELDALLPMTKSAIGAMDLLSTEHYDRFDGISLTGASKRGWTALLAAALNDTRIKNVAPIVAPFFGMQDQFTAQYQAYGDFSFAIEPYKQFLQPWFSSVPSFFERLAQSLPETYVEIINQYPKYFSLASRDEFFMPDVGQYFWELLDQPKYLFIAPNANHGFAQLGPQDPYTPVIESMTVINLLPQLGIPLPQYDYTISPDGGTIALDITFSTPTSAFISNVSYTATPYFSEDKNSRDWRYLRCYDGIEIDPSCVILDRDFLPGTPTSITPGTPVNVTASSPSANNWTAFYIVVEAKLETNFAGLLSFWFSSDMSIIPRNQYPYAECGIECSCGYDCSVCPPPTDGGDGEDKGSDDDDNDLLGLLGFLVIFPCLCFIAIVAFVAVVVVGLFVNGAFYWTRVRQRKLLSGVEAGL